MPLAVTWLCAAICSALLYPVDATAQARSAPPSTLIVHSIGITIWNDTLPTHSDSIGCRNFLHDVPRTRRLAQSEREFKYRCDKIAAGRRLRDSSLVAVQPSDTLSRIFVAAARIPHRVEAGPHPCPWGDSPPRGAALDLAILFRPLSPDSGIANIVRTCRQNIHQEYESNESYLLRRTPTGWVILERGTKVT